MAGIQITLVDDNSGDEYTISLPGDLQASDLIQGLIDKLGLPITGPDGQGMSYRLQCDDGTVLNEDETLEQAGVEAGSTIHLSSQMEAGFYHFLLLLARRIL